MPVLTMQQIREIAISLKVVHSVINTHFEKEERCKAMNDSLQRIEEIQEALQNCSEN